MKIEAESAADMSVEATLNYVAPDSLINRRFTFPGDEVNTGRFQPYRVTIRNARRAPERPTLASHGFELFRHRSLVPDFGDRAAIDALYPDEVVAAIKGLTGADLVVPIGYIRRTSADTSAGQAQPPAADVHVDMSPKHAPQLARMLFDRAGPAGGGYRRFLATSLWRAYSAPPQDWPLALCDGTSIAPAEGVPNVLVRLQARPDPAAMLAEIADEDELPAALIFHYAPHHRWYYFPDMNRDEIVLLKLHDSDHDQAWFAPHTAFRDEQRRGAHTRESIEFRSIAYWL
jgi:hypothetical protein